MAEIVQPDGAAIARAVERLRGGGLVAIPTETVYGLAADARQAAAVQRIFAAKGRPADHPVIVHVGAAEALVNWAREIPAAAWALARAFWPGPLTLILKRLPDVLDAVTGGQDTVGVRCPAHPVALTLIRTSGLALAAPSANLFGRVSPTTAAHVHADFAHGDLLILDGGPCEVGVESTIVDLTRIDQLHALVLLRPGAIGPQALAAVAGLPVVAPDGSAPRVSGALAAHYAPRKPLAWLSPERASHLAHLDRAQSAWLGPDVAAAGQWAWHASAPADAGAYAQGLYGWLRAMDASDARQLYIAPLPDAPAWDAVRDRLGRAIAGAGRMDAGKS